MIRRNYKFLLLFIALVFISVIHDSEARRKILRGRKTVNRHYMTPLALPAWVIVLLIGIGQIIIGGLLYVLCKVVILDRPIQTPYRSVPQAGKSI